MPSYRNLNDLFIHVGKEYIEKIVGKIGKESFDMLYKEIEVEWYNRRFTPQQYDRTMQLLHSLTYTPVIKNKNEWYVKIYYDTDKIIPMDGTVDKPWTRHKSIVDNESSAEALPYYIEYGNGDSPIYQYEGVSPVGNVKGRLIEDNYVLERFKEILALKGIKYI